MTSEREANSVCFEVTVNGEKRVLAGGDEAECVTAIVTYVPARGILDLQVGGIVASDTTSSEHVTWLKGRKLAVGDQVMVRVVESSEPDPPEYRDPRSPEEIVEESRRRYYEKLKREYEGEG